MVILTQFFSKLHTINNVKRYKFNAGLDGFLDLNICGIDMAQVMELLEKMDDNDIATVTDQHEEKK